MEQLCFDKLLLKTAFSCMACDGEINKKEVALIKSIHKEKSIFGEIDINSELDLLLSEINREGQQFLRNYLNELKSDNLTEQEELKLIETAINILEADEKVEYSEIKFFKVIRSKLKIDNEKVLMIHPEFEDYIEQDILSESYLAKLQDEFFSNQSLPKFEVISHLDIDIVNKT